MTILSHIIAYYKERYNLEHYTYKMTILTYYNLLYRAQAL